jgi:hypothetical protein
VTIAELRKTASWGNAGNLIHEITDGAVDWKDLPIYKYYNRKCTGSLLKGEGYDDPDDQIHESEYIPSLDSATNAELCCRLESTCRKWVDWSKNSKTRMWDALASTMACSVYQEVLWTLVETGGSDWSHLDPEGDAICRGKLKEADISNAEWKFMMTIRPVPWGVLGSQLSCYFQDRVRAPLPEQDMVILDPMVEAPSEDASPAGIVGTSGRIYYWIGITQPKVKLNAEGEPEVEPPKFPAELFEKDSTGNSTVFKREGDALFHKYEKGQVIHCIAPDLSRDCYRTSKGGSKSFAIAALTKVYTNVLTQFVASGAKKIRLCPVSFGQSCGEYTGVINQMTIDALRKAFKALDVASQDFILGATSVELCILREVDYELYSEAVSEARTGAPKYDLKNLVVRVRTADKAKKKEADDGNSSDSTADSGC